VRLRRVYGSAHAVARTASFVLQLMPMLPSRMLERASRPPVHEQTSFPGPLGTTVADVFRPARGGPHAGVVLCLGVVPAGLDHPQIERFAAALARSGFVALIYWSPAMQVRELDPSDGAGLAAAFEHMLGLPGVDPSRCGLVGTCVGASFALLAAAEPSISDRVAFVGAFAPYASLETLTRSIATRTADGRPWSIDPLTWTAYVRALTAELPPDEADRLRDGFATPDRGDGRADSALGLGADARAVRRVLIRVPHAEADEAFAALPESVRARLQSMSPLACLGEIRAPILTIAHDRDDPVIPVGESRLLRRRLGGRPGFHYTELSLFKHADPMARRVVPHRLPLELARLVRFVYPIFAAASGGTRPGTSSGRS
jgi:dienelactone hydrolase